jgi:hypothetical protein
MHYLSSCIPFVLKFVGQTLNVSKVIQTRNLVRKDGQERTIFISSVDYEIDFLEPYPVPESNQVRVIHYREVFALQQFRERLANLLSDDSKIVKTTVLLDVDEECNTILLARFTSRQDETAHESEEEERFLRTEQCLPIGALEEHVMIGDEKKICGFCGSLKS